MIKPANIYLSKVNNSNTRAQQKLQHRFNVVFRSIWRRNVSQHQINVETTLYTSTMKFKTFNNVESTLSISTLNWAMLANVKTTSFSTSTFTTLGNVETTFRIWPFEKQNNIFELQRMCWTRNLHFFPILRGICKWIFAEPQTSNILNTKKKTIFKQSRFVKCQLVFNFTRRQVQAHYGYFSFNFMCIL